MIKGASFELQVGGVKSGNAKTTPEQSEAKFLSDDNDERIDINKSCKKQ